MQMTFEDLSPLAIAAAIEQNGFAFFLSLSTPLQAEVYEDAQILRVITRLPFSPSMSSCVHTLSRRRSRGR